MSIAFGHWEERALCGVDDGPPKEKRKSRSRNGGASGYMDHVFEKQPPSPNIPTQAEEIAEMCKASRLVKP